MGDDPAATDLDRRFLRRAYEVARSAAANGNHPFGALLVRGGEVVAETENAVVTTGDVTLHAETGLVAAVTRRLDAPALAESTLYTSTEPCLMCCGAIHWAGIGRMVYGASGAGMAGVLGEAYRGVPARELLARIASPVEVVGPVLLDEGLRIHEECWGG